MGKIVKRFWSGGFVYRYNDGLEETFKTELFFDAYKGSYGSRMHKSPWRPAYIIKRFDGRREDLYWPWKTRP